MRSVLNLGGLLCCSLKASRNLGCTGQNWPKYQSSCETLHHERYLYMARVRIYAGMDDDERPKLLTTQVEKLVLQEHTNWVEQHQGCRQHEAQEIRPLRHVGCGSVLETGRWALEESNLWPLPSELVKLSFRIARWSTPEDARGHYRKKSVSRAGGILVCFDD